MEIIKQIKAHHGKETLRTIKFMRIFRHFFAINILVFFCLPVQNNITTTLKQQQVVLICKKCLNWALGQINRKHHWSYGHNLLSNTVDLVFSYTVVNNTKKKKN